MVRLVLALSMLFCFAGNSMASSLTVSQKIVMQTAMNRHIESNTVDGIMQYVDLKTGQVKELIPTKSHPMIMTLGDKYVLCTDFRDQDGNPVNVDFYVTASNGGFTIFQTEIDNRNPLKKLIKDGKAKMTK